MTERDTTAERIGALLGESGLTLAVAESCTGGMIGQAITSAAGSSEYFLGGVIAYHNSIKVSLLNVSEATLKQDGAVSEATAVEMARGVRERLNADVGLSITGIAGPAGGTPDKPVGTIYVTVAVGEKIRSKLFSLSGDRAEIRRRATESALMLLVDELD